MKASEFKKLRERSGLSQTEVAKLLKVGVSTISMWEHGHRKITPSRAEYIRWKLERFAVA